MERKRKEDHDSRVEKRRKYVEKIVQDLLDKYDDEDRPAEESVKQQAEAVLEGERAIDTGAETQEKEISVEAEISVQAGAETQAEFAGFKNL